MSFLTSRYPWTSRKSRKSSGSVFLALAMEWNAKLTLLKGPRGAGQIIAEARTVGTERLAAPQKQGTKWPFWLYPLRVPGWQMAKKQVISKRQHLSPPERVC